MSIVGHTVRETACVRPNRDRFAGERTNTVRRVAPLELRQLVPGRQSGFDYVRRHICALAESRSRRNTQEDRQ